MKYVQTAVHICILPLTPATPYPVNTIYMWLLVYSLQLYLRMVLRQLVAHRHGIGPAAKQAVVQQFCMLRLRCYSRCLSPLLLWLLANCNPVCCRARLRTRHLLRSTAPEYYKQD